jgi:hypothetical protein
MQHMIEVSAISIIWSFKMDFASLALLAVAVVGFGSAATVLLTCWIPQPVAELAEQHGRFAGLGEAGSGPVAPAAPYGGRMGAKVQQEAMNVVRTSN